MGISATPDNDITFDEQASALSDEELLNLWEHSQRVILALRMAMNGDTEARDGTEDAIIRELTRRALRRGRTRAITLAPPGRRALVRSGGRR